MVTYPDYQKEVQLHSHTGIHNLEPGDSLPEV